METILMLVFSGLLALATIGLVYYNNKLFNANKGMLKVNKRMLEFQESLLKNQETLFKLDYITNVYNVIMGQYPVEKKENFFRSLLIVINKSIPEYSEEIIKWFENDEYVGEDIKLYLSENKQKTQ